jgi:NAD-reducing hydrogenase large subunit
MKPCASVARDYLSGHELTEGLLNHIEVAIRAYDPCLSCATHALGQMPLEVTLLAADGSPLDRVQKRPYKTLFRKGCAIRLSFLKITSCRSNMYWT